MLFAKCSSSIMFLCNAGKVSNQTDLYIYSTNIHQYLESTFTKTAQMKQPILESPPMQRTK